MLSWNKASGWWIVTFSWTKWFFSLFGVFKFDLQDFSNVAILFRKLKTCSLCPTCESSLVLFCVGFVTDCYFHIQIYFQTIKLLFFCFLLGPRPLSLDYRNRKTILLLASRPALYCSSMSMKFSELVDGGFDVLRCVELQMHFITGFLHFIIDSQWLLCCTVFLSLL